MSKRLPQAMHKFFADKHGKMVVFQRPNIALGGWLICKALVLLLPSGRIDTGLNTTATFLLFTWAYLEITSGVSYFRRLLGALILTMLVINAF